MARPRDSVGWRQRLIVFLAVLAGSLLWGMVLDNIPWGWREFGVQAVLAALGSTGVLWAERRGWPRVRQWLAKRQN